MIFRIARMKEEMKDVWTTSVSEETLDEAPEAYKPMRDILDVIGGTTEILGVMKPVYNFKASEGGRKRRRKRKSA